MSNTKTANIFSLLAAASLLSACVTSPTVPAPGSRSAPPPSSPGTAGSPGSPPGSPASQQSNSGQQRSTATNGQTKGQSEQQAASASHAGKQQTQGERPSTQNTGSNSQTDDEILADALKAFEKGKQTQENAATSTSATAERAAAGSASTDAESTQQIKNQLDEKFAKFDQLLLNERDALKNEDNREGGGGRGTGNGTDGSGLFGDEDGDLEALLTANAPPTAPSANSRQKTGEENIEASDIRSERNVPDDIPDADGDDVIAKQLREAAIKEPDPELRAKLWDEYRKYKKSL